MSVATRFAVLATVTLVACASPAYRAAKEGDFARLKSEILEKHALGKLSNGEAACLAHAVASREIALAKDEASALARVRETGGCAGELDDAFEERMKHRDGAGAEAALARLEGGNLGEGEARAWLGDADDRWRAVAVRTLHREEDQKARRAAILDPSPRVRRSAIRAASRANDVGDLDLLFDTARLDPEPLLRNEALRAMSAIVRGAEDRPRAAELATRLRDLWTSGDDAIREDIAVAWALAPVFEGGGREALRVQIAKGAGPGAIAAAGVVQRTASTDAELARSSAALLTRSITDGSLRDRLHAIAIARVDGTQMEALRKAAREEDRDVRVPAYARLLESNVDHDAAVRELEAVASRGTKAGEKLDDERSRAQTTRARLALASAGDLRIQTWIEEDLTAPEPQRRLSAASSLAALGRSARAALLLADPDVSVRTRAACTMITGARR
jgi:hypothetical protein